jgi:hypothetical protein
LRRDEWRKFDIPRTLFPLGLARKVLLPQAAAADAKRGSDTCVIALAAISVSGYHFDLI